jgi:hypothetical protein
MRSIYTGLLLALLAASCAGRGEPGFGDSPERPSTAASEQQDTQTSAQVETQQVEDFQLRLAQVEDEAVGYRNQMTSADMTSVADCLAARDQYESDVRPSIDEMMDMGDGMDQYVSAHHGVDAADVACVAANMRAELDHHHELACAEQDLDADRQEVQRHVDAMLSYVEHSWQRCDQMMAGIDTGNWQWGRMMTACEDWSDTADECVEDSPHDTMMSGGMMMGDVCD